MFTVRDLFSPSLLKIILCLICLAGQALNLDGPVPPRPHFKHK